MSFIARLAASESVIRCIAPAVTDAIDDLRAAPPAGALDRVTRSSTAVFTGEASPDRMQQVLAAMRADVSGAARFCPQRDPVATFEKVSKIGPPIAAQRVILAPDGGAAGVVRLSGLGSREKEASIWLRPDLRKTGLADLAAREAMEIAFDESPRLAKIRLNVPHRNRGSRKLAKRLGFERDHGLGDVAVSRASQLVQRVAIAVATRSRVHPLSLTRERLATLPPLDPTPGA